MYILFIYTPYNFLFYRYEWKHRGSTHIHGFLWLDGAPNMETLDWKDEDQVNKAKVYLINMLQLGILEKIMKQTFICIHPLKMTHVC